MGGAGTGGAFQANVAALAKIKLNLRVVHGVSQPDTHCELWGQSLSLPILAAPIGGVAFNMTEGVSEADYINAVVGGCAEAGILGCVGDGVPPVILDSGLTAIAAAGGAGIPLIKPWGDDELNEKLARAKDSGALAVGMDLDACGLITLSLMGRPVKPRPPQALREIIEPGPTSEVHSQGHHDPRTRPAWPWRPGPTPSWSPTTAAGCWIGPRAPPRCCRRWPRPSEGG